MLHRKIAAADKRDEEGKRVRPRVTLPLRSAVLLLTLAITAPALILYLNITYSWSDRAALDRATALMSRFQAQTIEDIAGEFEVLEGLIATAAELGSQDPTFFATDRALGYLFSALAQRETMLSVYVGLEDGAFRQARRLHASNVAFHGKLPPPGANYAFRSIVAAPGQPMLDRYTFLSPDRVALGGVATESGYDPRRRAWYAEAVAAGTTTVTDPEVFWAFGLVGLTVAAPYDAEGRLAGVVAADITLDSFSHHLAAGQLSANSLSFLLDGDGSVLAASDLTTSYGGANDTVDLRHVTDIEDPLVKMAYAATPNFAPDRIFTISHDKQDYVVSLSGFGEALGRPWQLLVIAPMSDFAADLDRKQERFLIIGVLALLVQLTAGYVLATGLAGRLRRLKGNLERLASGEAGMTPPLRPLRSRITEIVGLSKAIDGIRAIRMAVPEPEPTIERLPEQTPAPHSGPGGQSKFLTMLSARIDGAASLNDRLTVRELFDWMSTLLELIDTCIHRERGNIHALTADHVEGFWGAPEPLNDHAWRACVAALRIKQSFRLINEILPDHEAGGFEIKIGIHSDTVLVGNIGPRADRRCAVIGGLDIAARLTGSIGISGTVICISHETVRETGDLICVRPVDEIAGPDRGTGRDQPTVVYELIGAYGAGADLEPTPDELALADLTASAFAALRAGDRAAARAGYAAVLARQSSDPVARKHLDRLSGTSAASDGAANAAG
ncbi:MAG: hypothetical protein ACFBRM_13670 [Pikeienuella sp.]